MERPSFALYDASAGSGKTYTLVKEYLKIILSASKNDAYRNILAITFTNKAVHEMKSRIVGNLSEFAKEDPSAKATALLQDLAVETGLSALQIKSKSQQIIKHLIHNYAAFDISTIDKFTHKVIRAFAHDLGLPMTFEVTLDTENLLIEAVDAIIALAGEDQTLTKLLIDFTMEKTDDDKSWDISREILETGKLALNENNRNEIAHFQNTSIKDFMLLKTELIARCKELEEQNATLAKELLSLIDHYGLDPKSFSRGTFPNHLQSIAELRFNPKNKMFRHEQEVGINKNAKDKEQIEAVLPEFIKGLVPIYQQFEKCNFYRAFLKNITPLSLLNTVSRELTKIQNEQHILSIAEFNAIIHREIQNQPAPFIYERLGERYRHFFIDEFQDTSEMQWQNLIPLIDNALAGQDDSGQKGTLMIVGDPKQSIYRWRGGKAEQFIALAKDEMPFSNPDKKVVHLDTNYRSYSQVIEFNNDFFQLLAEEFSNVDYKDLYQNHSRQKINEKKGGYVNMLFLPIVESEEEGTQKKDLYLQSTLDTIEKVLGEGFQYKDIAILTRKKEQGIAVANHLTEHCIPLLSSETLMIQNASEVRLIIQVLKYLKNSLDLESKANFLYYLGQHKQQSLELHDFIAEGMQLAGEEAFENWLANCNMALSFKNIRKKSLYEAVEIIISKFLKGNNPDQPAALESAYVQYFLDIVLEREVRNQAGIADFLEYWDKNGHKYSIPSPEGSNAVRIMTIHKSKGLEFPVVIMPFAEEDYSRKPKDKLWLDAGLQGLDIPKVLVDNSSAVENFGQEASQLYHLKKQEELLDNINVLYVALTRAEEQLYIISQKLLPSKEGELPGNMASFFIKYLQWKNLYKEDQLEYAFGSSSSSSQKLRHQDTSKYISTVSQLLDPKSIRIAQREAMMWGTHQGEAIAFGNIVHEILSFIQTKEDIEAAIVKAIESGLITRVQEKIVCKAINDIVNHPDLTDYFEKGNIILNEKSLIQKEANTIKPDRIVINLANEVFLLDYKTGQPHAKYTRQLENYQMAIEKMGYNITKKALVYIGKQVEVLLL